MWQIACVVIRVWIGSLGFLRSADARGRRSILRPVMRETAEAHGFYLSQGGERRAKDGDGVKGASILCIF